MKQIDPKDPFRDLRLAVNASRVLGGLLIALGVIAFLGLMVSGIGPLFAIAGGLFFAVPGFLYLVFAMQLQAHKTWAAVVLLVMAVLHTIMMGIQMISNLGLVLDSDRPNSAGGALFGLLIAGIFCLVGVLLIKYLSRCFGIIRMYGVKPQSYGFQPVMTPVPGPSPAAPLPAMPVLETAANRDVTQNSD